MKIECPGCKLSGTIDDSTVPATGLTMSCPRCKTNFTAEKPVLQAGAAVAMLDTCPVCQYSTFTEEKFAVCPKCGLVAADYHKQQLTARQVQNKRPPSPLRQMQEQNSDPLPRLTPEQLKKEEESRRKHGLDKIPGVVEVTETVIVSQSAETPLPILIVGWGTIIASILLLVYGGSGIMEYLAKVKEAKAALEALEEAQSRTTLLFQFLLFPVLSIIFSFVMLVFGARFLALKRWSINAVQKGAWAGVGLLALMKISDMLFWFKRASADASIGYYAMGVCGDLVVMILLIAPFLALADYLKSPLFEKLDDLFC